MYASNVAELSATVQDLERLIRSQQRLLPGSLLPNSSCRRGGHTRMTPHARTSMSAFTLDQAERTG